MKFRSPPSHLAFARACASVWAAKRLETGGLPFAGWPLRPFAHAAAKMLGRERPPIRIPAAVAVVAVGGSTLGGSYKTPLAIACARELAGRSPRGKNVVFVGHAYGAHPGSARVVASTDAVEQVGDEALLAAQELGRVGVEVIVAKTRAEAVTFAATRGDVVVIDGTTNVVGGRSRLRVLSVSADSPWGSGHVFPAGDLRSSLSRLRESADVLAPVSFSGDSSGDEEAELDIAALAEVVVPTECFERQNRDLRLGVFTAIARPDRFVRELERLGIKPRLILRAPDHAGPAYEHRAVRVSERYALDGWITTSKCALSLGDSWLGAPRHTAALRLALTPTFVSRLLLLIDGP